MKNTYEGRWANDNQSAYYEEARMLFRRVLMGEFQPVVAQQNIVESERVLVQVYKQKSSNVIARTEEMLTNFGFYVITPTAMTYKRFHGMVEKIVGGYDFFDFYLAATMLDNGITNIFTVNTRDFSMISGIRAVNPLLSPRTRT